jgi:hypothetical protein
MMRGESIFGSAATEAGGALDMAQMTVAFIGMMERFRSLKITWLAPGRLTRIKQLNGQAYQTDAPLGGRAARRNAA